MTKCFDSLLRLFKSRAALVDFNPDSVNISLYKDFGDDLPKIQIKILVGESVFSAYLSLSISETNEEIISFFDYLSLACSKVKNNGKDNDKKSS